MPARANGFLLLLACGFLTAGVFKLHVTVQNRAEMPEARVAAAGETTDPATASAAELLAALDEELTAIEPTADPDAAEGAEAAATLGVSESDPFAPLADTALADELTAVPMTPREERSALQLLELDRCLIEPVLGGVKQAAAEADARLVAVEAREQMVALVEARIDDKLTELRRSQEELNDLLRITEQQADEETRRLVAIYENMKAKDAATIFNRMPPEIGASFVRRMKEQRSSAIIAAMEPDRAYALTLAVANTQLAVRRRQAQFDGDPATAR